MDNGRTITYTYDALYRMTKAVTTGSTNYPAWGLSETYDRYGNRSTQSIASGCTGITCPTSSVTISATTNQLTGSPYTYDGSGDMTNDGVNTLTYDGEGRGVTASGSLGSGNYSVDGNGLRVKKVAGATTTVYIFSGSKVIAEYQNGAAPSAPTTEYIYAGAVLIAKINSSGTLYYHQDHLSNRMVTTSTGAISTQMGHFPFGESWYNATSDKLYFATYEYDSESGNHYAIARYHISRLGRLSSPDPLSGSTANPQTLNRYSYSVNDPANITDPSGATTVCNTAQTSPSDPSQQTSGSGGGHSPDGGEGDSGADPPQQQNGCVDRTNPWAGGSGTLDGVDISDIPSGLLGSSESTNTYVGTSATGFGFWLSDGSGGYWDPTDSLYTNPSQGTIAWSSNFSAALAETYGASDYAGGPNLPLFPEGVDQSGAGTSASHLVNPFARFKDCVKSLYNVNVINFVPAAPGSNGNFAGSFNGTTIRVETDVASYSRFTLTLKANPFQVLLGDWVAGLTLASNPNLNYIANDLSPAEMYPTTWTHELGHSLDLITAGKTSETSADRLQNCLTNSGK